MILVLTAMMMLSQHAHGAGPKQPKPGDLPPGQGTGEFPAMQGMDMSEEQKCQFACAREVRTCQMPAAGKTAADANNEEKRKQFMATTKDCMKKSQGCFDACAKKGKKDKGNKKETAASSTSGTSGTSGASTEASNAP